MTQPNSTILHGFIDNLRQKTILLGALLVLATLLLYGPVTHHEFLTLDDHPYVTKNIHVSTGLNLGNVVGLLPVFTRRTGIRSRGFRTWRIVNCLD